jgi:hypothetical protein
MTGEPPSDVGGSQVTLLVWSPAVALTFTGAPGVVDGVTAAESRVPPEPTALIALTRQKYAVPFVTVLSVAVSRLVLPLL